MFQVLRGFGLITALIFNSGLGLAADVESANYIMPGCRIVSESDPDSKDVINKVRFARCSGIIEGLYYRDDSKTVCPKGSVTNGQMIRVVVKYIDDRPERQHEYFKVLALEALRTAWPCKK
jgi:hypothetical protein